MNLWRRLACVVLVLVLGASVAANWLAPAGYARQYREATDAPPSRAHWLGTDEIGRDRFARVLYGTRISLLLAPAAALLSTLMAALIGGLAGYLGGIWARMAMAVTDLFLSLPWLFSADHGAGTDAAECVSLGFGAGDISAAGASGLDDCGTSVVHDRGSFARVGFCPASASRGTSRTEAVLDACSTELEAGALRAVLDFDSGLHLE